MLRRRKPPTIRVDVVLVREEETPAGPEHEPTKKSLLGPLSEEIEKGKPRWTYLVPTIGTLVQAMVAFIAALCILIPTWRSYVETQEKNRVEREENTTQRLERQYSEVEARLSNPDAQTRAVAVLQLADIAQSPLPAESMSTEDEEKKVMITDFSRIHYPFFLRAAREYATILPMEKNADVRAATKGAVFLLMRFLQKYMPQPKTSEAPEAPASSTALSMKALPAPEPEYAGAYYEIREKVQNKEKKVDEKITKVKYNITDVDVVLAEMTNELADANRKAKNNFVRAYANYSTKFNTKARKSLTLNDDLVVATTRFCSTDVRGMRATKAALKALRETSLFPMQQKIYEEERNAPNSIKEQQAKDAVLLDNLEQEAQKLVDTRDTLSITLTGYTPYGLNWRILVPPPGFRSEELETLISRLEQATETLEEGTTIGARKVAWDDLKRTKERIAVLTESQRRSPSISIRDCFLVGADLRNAQLQGANLQEAHLQGADLGGANLQGAMVAGVQWQGSRLYDAELQGTNLVEADMQDVDLFGANLQGTDLHDAHLEGVDLRETHLQGTDLRGAHLRRANLRYTHLQAAGLTLAELEWADLLQAHLQGSDLRWAHLQGADLDYAQLQGVDLSQVQLQGATLYGAEFDQKTCLYAIHVQEKGGTGAPRTDFSRVNWKDENFMPRDDIFKSSEADDRTRKVKVWLQTTFPTSKGN